MSWEKSTPPIIGTSVPKILGFMIPYGIFVILCLRRQKLIKREVAMKEGAEDENDVYDIMHFQEAKLPD